MAPARAGTYEVPACDAAPGGANNSWTRSATLGMATSTACPTQRQEVRGIIAASGLNAGNVPLFSKSTYSFDAPAGTTIEQLRAQFSIHRSDPYWTVGISADERQLVGCLANEPHNLCVYDTSWPGVTQTFNMSGAHNLKVQSACESLTGCSTAAIDAPYYERVGVHLYSAVVKVRDDSAPSVRTVDGAITTGGWLAGGHYLGHAASDNTGISETRLYIDNRRVDDRSRDCDYTKRIPCTDLAYGRYLVDTRPLSDGVHRYRLEARDAAGNVGSVSSEIDADNTPPDMPADVAVQGGENWRSSNGFHLRWTNPASAAPISSAHYELCNTETSTCVTG
ncbi:MAG: hypothetical protein E6G00_04300, partial [Actinobacteria bacterium]